MDSLSENAFHRAFEVIERKGRPLEKAIAAQHFNEGDAVSSFQELARYQNADGGFGKGLELDFSLPSSSPMATSHCFHYLDQIGSTDDAMVEGAIRYLEATYDPSRKGWISMSEDVNDHPHAPWWHFIDGEGGTAIDRYWGNPSADIIGSLYTHRHLLRELDVDALVEHAISRYEAIERFGSEHEMYCYIRLRDALPEDMAQRLASPIERAVSQLVCVDPSGWEEYLARPLEIAPSPEAERYGLGEEDIEVNLGYIVERLEESGGIEPHWSYGSEDPHWEDVRTRWTATLTLRSLIILRSYDLLP